MRKKIKKCFIKPLFALCSLTAAVLFAGVLYLQSYLPANYYVYEGSSLSVQGPVPLSCEKSALAAPVENTLGAQSYTVNLKAFGGFYNNFIYNNAVFLGNRTFNATRFFGAKLLLFNG